MKCQRGHYDIERIPIDLEFDEETMDNADKSGDIDDRVLHVVRVVLSDGIVKRPYRGSDEEIGRVWMPRVFVRELEYEVDYMNVAQDSQDKISGDQEQVEEAERADGVEPQDVLMS